MCAGKWYDQLHLETTVVGGSTHFDVSCSKCPNNTFTFETSPYVVSDLSSNTVYEFFVTAVIIYSQLGVESNKKSAARTITCETVDTKGKYLLYSFYL